MKTNKKSIREDAVIKIRNPFTNEPSERFPAFRMLLENTRKFHQHPRE